MRFCAALVIEGTGGSAIAGTGLTTTRARGGIAEVPALGPVIGGSGSVTVGVNCVGPTLTGGTGGA